jgi:phosphoribosylamine--glycine ligase
VKVLVVGSGGREHALVWKLAQSPQVTRLFCAPGNAGIAQQAECVPIGAEDIPALADFAEQQGVDLTLPGPEAPLIAGIVDEFRRRGLRIFGPTAAAARIEGSKVFAKRLFAKHGIPTGAFEVFTEPDAAKDYIRALGPPLVVKADGNALGKGAIVCHELDEALRAVDLIMVERAFGSAGDQCLVEECLVGPECSIKVFADGEAFVPMAPSQDHKRALDGDRGPNTGGMGCYSPVPAVSQPLLQEILDTIIAPTLSAMAEEGCPYTGVLYGGLMLTDDGPKVLEYNCRFGDPETQVVLPLLESDLVDILMAATEGGLAGLRREQARWSDDRCVCVVVASGGYPDAYEKGKPISGLDEAAKVENVVVFHAGTAERDGLIVTNGGRVLGVTALGADFPTTIRRAYEAVEKIHFENMYYRRDIAHRVLT